MGSRDSVQKGLEEDLGDDSEDRVSETVIVISPEGGSTSNSSGSVGDLNHSAKEIASNVPPVKDQIGIHLANVHGKDSCVIDVKCADGEDCDSEAKICRICHLDSDLQEPEVGPKIRMEVIELGCSCKGELGCAHSSCAATWFNQKGNRYIFLLLLH